MLMLLVSAVGCSDLVPPSDAWLKRSDNVATVGCYMTRKTWILTCDQTGRWTGTFGNCTQRTMLFHSTVYSTSSSDLMSFTLYMSNSNLSVYYTTLLNCLYRALGDP